VVGIVARMEAFPRVLKILTLSAIRPLFRTYLINIIFLAFDTDVILKRVPQPFCCYFSFSDKDININGKLFGVIPPYKTSVFASYTRWFKYDRD